MDARNVVRAAAFQTVDTCIHSPQPPRSKFSKPQCNLAASARRCVSEEKSLLSEEKLVNVR